MSAKRILLIDDEIDFTELAQVALERGGDYEVKTLNDARGASALAREFKPDLIVSDIVMPNMDGAELIREFKQDTELQKIPIIVMSALLNENARAYKELGEFEIADVLEKPVKLGELRNHIQAAIG